MKYKDGEMGAVNGMLPNGKVDFCTLQSEEIWIGVVYALASLMIHKVKLISSQMKVFFHLHLHCSFLFFRTWYKKGGKQLAVFTILFTIKSEWDLKLQRR